MIGMSTLPKKHTLTEEELREKIICYNKEEDPQVQEELVAHYREMVEILAAKFARGTEPFEDLVQVGMVGLIAALRRFDASYGGSFEGFAVPTIIGEIKRHIRDKTWSVHVPRRIKELGPRIKKSVEELTIRLQRSPKVDEIADFLGVTTEEVLETMEMSSSYHAMSVDTPIDTGEGNHATLLDFVGDDDQGYNQVDQKILLEKAFQALTKREQAVINLTFFLNMSQKMAGEKLGISQMHVSRIQRRALDKLRAAIKLDPSEII